jgi:hypothetical protein
MLRRLVQIAGGIVALIGLIDLPDQLHKWADVGSRLRLDQDAMRWGMFGVGMLVVLAAQFWPTRARRASAITPLIAPPSPALDARPVQPGSLQEGAGNSGSVAQPSTEGGQAHGLSTPILRDRIIVNVSPQFLIGFFEQHTTVQAKKLVEAYIGKWMRVSGPLGDVWPNQVTFEHRLFGSAVVFMYFSPEWTDRLSVLRRGDHLAVLGQIRNVNSMEVHLENCELAAP